MSIKMIILLWIIIYLDAGIKFISLCNIFTGFCLEIWSYFLTSATVNIGCSRPRCPMAHSVRLWLETQEVGLRIPTASDVNPCLLCPDIYGVNMVKDVLDKYKYHLILIK